MEGDGVYKVVCRKDAAVQGNAPRWEQGCPIQIQVLQISRDTESSELFLQARIMNISDRDVAAYKLTAEITHDDNTKDTFVIDVLDADLPAGKTQDLSPKPVGKGTVSDTELVALSVQQGGATWQSCAKPSGLPQRTLLELPDELRIIRRHALRKAGVNQVNKVLDGAVCDAPAVRSTLIAKPAAHAPRQKRPSEVSNLPTSSANLGRRKVGRRQNPSGLGLLRQYQP